MRARARSRAAVAQAQPVELPQAPALPAAPAWSRRPSPRCSRRPAWSCGAAKPLRPAGWPRKPSTDRRWSGPKPRPCCVPSTPRNLASGFSSETDVRHRGRLFNLRDFAQAASIFHAVDLSLLETDKQAQAGRSCKRPRCSRRRSRWSAPNVGRHAPAARPAHRRPPTGRPRPRRKKAWPNAPGRCRRSSSSSCAKRAWRRRAKPRALPGRRHRPGPGDAPGPSRPSLREAQLEPERLALLQRPVDARLQTFKMLEANDGLRENAEEPARRRHRPQGPRGWPRRTRRSKSPS